MPTSEFAPQDTHALIVGIESYGFLAEDNLSGPVMDAWRLVAWLLDKGVPRENISLFLAPLEATKSDAATVQPQLASHIPIANWPCSQGLNPAALREKIRGYVHMPGQLLLVHWGGHGVVENTQRYLMHEGASTSDPQSWDLNEILKTLRDRRLAGIRHQVFFIDACATLTSRKRFRPIAAASFPEVDETPEVEQLIFLATSRGEVAINLNDRQKGLFSSLVLTLLKERGLNWPDFQSLEQDIKDAVTRARNEGTTDQNPLVVWHPNALGQWSKWISPNAAPHVWADISEMARHELTQKLQRCEKVFASQNRLALVEALPGTQMWSTMHDVTAEMLIDHCLKYSGGLEDLAAFVGRLQNFDAVATAFLRSLPEVSERAISWEWVARFKREFIAVPLTDEIALKCWRAVLPGRPVVPMASLSSAMLDEASLSGVTSGPGCPLLEFVLAVEEEVRPTTQRGPSSRWTKLCRSLAKELELSLPSLRRKTRAQLSKLSTGSGNAKRVLVQVDVDKVAFANRRSDDDPRSLTCDFSIFLFVGHYQEEAAQLTKRGKVEDLAEILSHYADQYAVYLAHDVERPVIFELLLPWFLLDRKLEDLGFCFGLGDRTIKIGAEWPLVLRSHDRFFSPKLRKGFHNWKMRWDSMEMAIRSWPASPRVEWLREQAYWPSEASCYEANCYVPLRDSEHFLVVTTQLCEVGGQASATLMSVLDTGVPGALWLHPDPDIPPLTTELLREQLIQYPLELWPQMVFNWRSQSFPWPEVNYVALFWDDPTLAPPLAITHW